MIEKGIEDHIGREFEEKVVKQEHTKWLISNSELYRRV